MNVCPACFTGRLQRRQIAYVEWHGKKLLVVNRMPAIVCDVCGERIYDHDALEHLQRLIWSNPVPAAASIPSRNR
ncbi:MAG: YgiT-type zinc finger protein [Chloroflexota bacterium]